MNPLHTHSASQPVIVVLDGFTLNPGDISWDELRRLGHCRIHDRTPPELVVERAQGARMILTNKAIVSREAIEQLPDLKYIGVLATGYNIVDVAAARERGIPVANVPGYSTRSVAQLVFALILELTHHAGHHALSVQSGKWSSSADFSYWDYPLVELDGLTLGIVGLGQIGRAVAQLGQAFGMKILATTRTAPAPAPGVRFTGLETLFLDSDVISLHCPLTPETRGLVNAQRISWMKPTAFLINTARGPLVDEAALAEALGERRIAGAGLDVLAVEPPPEHNPLLRVPNCIITPHFAWASGAARLRLMAEAVENVRAFLRGQPRNVVNPG